MYNTFSGMIDFFQYLCAFVLTLSLLVVFHEFGHFWVARAFGVKVLRFSVGFGKPLWLTHFGPDNTEFVIAAVPLGGYVKMLDEREGDVAGDELGRAFNRQPIAVRTAIVVAGPLFNFIFAVFAFWGMFVIGLSGLKPVVGEVRTGSIAQLAGVVEGLEITAVDSRPTKIWTTVVDALVEAVIDGRKATIRVREDDMERSLTLNLTSLSIDALGERDLLGTIGVGVKRYRLPPVVGKVQSGLPADRAGMMAGDRIVAADGQAVEDWQQWIDMVRAHPMRTMAVTIERNNHTLTLALTPDSRASDDGITGFIGAANQLLEDMFARESYAMAPAFLKGVGKTWDMSWLTLRMIGRMITGQASVKNLSGPISIAQYAGRSAERGMATFLWFLGVVSVSLGVLNLLPIPLLDGGHLLYYAVELLTGGAVSESLQAIGQQIGVALLLGLTILVFYNDIVRLIG